MRRSLWLSGTLMAALVAVGCTTPVSPTRLSPTARTARPVTTEPAATMPPVLATPGIGTSGNGIISNNGSSLSGQISAPASLISDKGSSYRTLDVAESPYASATVSLYTADGSPVVDSKGQPLSTRTDATGHYSLPYSGGAQNVLVEAALPADKGKLIAFVAQGQLTKPTEVDVDLTSTLEMGYILDQYVKGQQAVLQKLPGDIEAQTRQAVAKAISATSLGAPSALPPSEIDSLMFNLRSEDSALDQQMETVRALLLGGLSNEGAGLPASSVETDAGDIAVTADGQIYFTGQYTARVWTKDANGLLEPVAGSGDLGAELQVPAPTASAAGDGGPALQAPFTPFAMARDAAGNLYVGDKTNGRIRKISPAGTISTLAASASWWSFANRTGPNLVALACAPDGSLVAAFETAVDRIQPDGTVTTIAGNLAQRAASVAQLGDNGPAAAALFGGLADATVDPATGDIYVVDVNAGEIRRISHADGTITAFAGNGKLGLPQEGAQALQTPIGESPAAIAFAPSGALLIADEDGHLRQIANGVITTLAGAGTGFSAADGPGKTAVFAQLSNVRVGADGDIYLDDDGNIRRLDAQGNLTTVVGTKDLGTKPLPAVQANLHPSELAYDPSTNSLIVSEYYRLRRLTLDDDTVQTLALYLAGNVPFQDGASALSVTFTNFDHAWVDPDGTLLYLGKDIAGAYRFVKQSNGVVTTLAGSGSLDAADAAGLSHVFTQVGVPALTAYLSPGPIAHIGDTYYTAWPGKVFGANVDNANIRSFTVGGNLTAFAGFGSRTDDGAPAQDFQFTEISGLAVDPQATSMYVSESNVIYRIDLTTKTVIRYAGTGVDGTSADGGPALSAAISNVANLACDASGNLYFCDQGSSRVRKVNHATGIISSVAGPGTPNLSGSTVDGSLSDPAALAFDRDGNLYIADIGHSQLLKVPAYRLQ